MTVGELKKLLEEVPDNVPVLIPGYDHSYEHRLNGAHIEVARNPDKFIEFQGESYLEDNEYATMGFVIS